MVDTDQDRIPNSMNMGLWLYMNKSKNAHSHMRNNHCCFDILQGRDCYRKQMHKQSRHLFQHCNRHHKQVCRHCRMYGSLHYNNHQYQCFQQCSHLMFHNAIDGDNFLCHDYL